MIKSCHNLIMTSMKRNYITILIVPVKLCQIFLTKKMVAIKCNKYFDMVFCDKKYIYLWRLCRSFYNKTPCQINVSWWGLGFLSLIYGDNYLFFHKEYKSIYIYLYLYYCNSLHKSCNFSYKTHFLILCSSQYKFKI